MKRRLLSSAVFVILLVPAPAYASGNRHHKDHEGNECRQNCPSSGEGDGRKFCFMPCDFTITVPELPGQQPKGVLTLP